MHQTALSLAVAIQSQRNARHFFCVKNAVAAELDVIRVENMLIEDLW